MITTDKPFPRYDVKCDCGKAIEFASNQKAGHPVSWICECFKIGSGLIPSKHSGQYKQQQHTTDLRFAILDIFVSIPRQMTVRQVYYRAVANGVIDKTENGYSKVSNQLRQMRQEGLLPYLFIADNTRSFLKAESYNTLEDALQDQMRTFKSAVWRDKDEHIEIWLEKDALSSIFYDVTYEYDVHLLVSRGFASESFIYQTSEMIKRIGKPTTIYFFSDYDPSGIELSKSVEYKLPRFGVDVNFIRVGLNQSQIEQYNLSTRKTKRSKKKPYKWFVGDSCDLDSLHPDTLTEMVESCILNHISIRDLEIIKVEEAVHKQGIDQIIKAMTKSL